MCLISPTQITIIYTTNTNESLHMHFRKIIKNRRNIPSDEAATKLVFLALRNIKNIERCQSGLES